MDFLSKTVFITGITGFTGRYISDLYKSKNYQVFGSSNNKEDQTDTIYYCDVLDFESMSEIIRKIKPNIVIHLAAISYVGHKDVSQMYNVNILGTKNLLEAIRLFAHDKIEKILVASSATVYGNQEKPILDESMCPNPINDYGISKLAMEFVCKSYFQSLPIIVVRPFNYTAPEQNINFVVPKITSAFKNRQAELELGNIDVYREYNSIHLITQYYFLLSISPHKSQVVNLCSGHTYSLKEIIDKCATITNHSLEIKINPAFVRSNEIISLSGSTQKLKELISLPTEFSIDQTLMLFFKQ
ncbi:MAG: GDP-mannose 4,6-dehydratase [Flavobacteriaceae bacterium]